MTLIVNWSRLKSSSARLGTNSGDRLMSRRPPSLALRARRAADRFLPVMSIASALRSFATTSLGRCFFRRLAVIESLLARRAVDLHICRIRFFKAGHAAWVA
jgi:hypothetical protein